MREGKGKGIDGGMHPFGSTAPACVEQKAGKSRTYVTRGSSKVQWALAHGVGGSSAF